MKEISVKTVSLGKTFGDFRALGNLNLDVYQGEIFGLLGPNGAGKTTTIRLITGLLRPSEGCVYVAGINTEENPVEAKKKFALLPDVPYLYKKLTGWEFMNFVARIYEIKKTDLKEEIDRILSVFNIKQVAHDLIDSYSHGMRQRLLLASVVLRDPDIIILDEPMVGLDPEAARMVKDMFKKMASESKTIFLSTHTLSDAQELCDRIAIINRGELLALGTFEELKNLAGEIKKKAGASDRVPDTLEDVYLSITANG